MQLNLASGVNALITLLIVMAGAASTWKVVRRNTRDAMKEAMNGYQALAEIRSQEIERLSQALSQMKTELDSLRNEQARLNREHANALQLNISLQQELRESQKENVSLREIIRQNAAEKADLLERIERLEQQGTRRHKGVTQ